MSPARTPRWALPRIASSAARSPRAGRTRQVRGRVDVEDVRRAEERDEDARERRAGEPGEGRAALDDAVRLGDRLLVLADELRQDHPLSREVRRHEAAEGEHEREQQREAQQVGAVQERNRGQQRRARGVADEHRRPAAQALDERAARDAEDRHRQDLDGEDDAHLGRRPRRDEHEPGQRQVGHARAEDRDDLGGDECGQRGLLHGFLLSGGEIIVRLYVFVK